MNFNSKWFKGVKKGTHQEFVFLTIHKNRLTCTYWLNITEFLPIADIKAFCSSRGSVFYPLIWMKINIHTPLKVLYTVITPLKFYLVGQVENSNRDWRWGIQHYPLCTTTTTTKRDFIKFVDVCWVPVGHYYRQCVW